VRPVLIALWLALPAAAIAEEPAEPAKPVEPATAVAASGDAKFATIDRLELGTTSITGNQELPKVMYVVPWKKAELGDLAGRPARSLIDEILAPVDRDVFRREVGYFETLDGENRQAAAQAETQVTPQTAQP
jgi:hypothetical protein